MKPNDFQINFENVVFAPLGSALMIVTKKKKYVCGSVRNAFVSLHVLHDIPRLKKIKTDL